MQSWLPFFFVFFAALSLSVAVTFWYNSRWFSRAQARLHWVCGDSSDSPGEMFRFNRLSAWTFLAAAVVFSLLAIFHPYLHPRP